MHTLVKSYLRVQNPKKAGSLLLVYRHRSAAQGALVSAHKESSFICLQVHLLVTLCYHLFRGLFLLKQIYLINFFGRKT